MWQKSLNEPSVNLEEVIKKFEEIVGEDFLKEEKNDFDLMFDTEMNYLEIEDASYEIEELLLNLTEEFFKRKTKNNHK